MIQNIRADGGMNSGSECNFEFCAHAVSAGHQDRIAKPFTIDFEERAEAANRRKHSASKRAPGHGANAPLRLISDRDIHSSIGVTHRSKALYWSKPAAALESMEQA